MNVKSSMTRLIRSGLASRTDRGSKQVQALEARIASVTDDDAMAERLRDLDDRARHLDVGFTRRWVAGGGCAANHPVSYAIDIARFFDSGGADVGR